MSTGNRVKLFAMIGSVCGLTLALIAGLALSEDVRPVRPGSRAPGFRALNVVTGDTVSLNDYAGDIILLNIWATWCAPCEAEMPSMQRLHEMLGPSGLKIIAVSVDDDDPELVARWVEERELTFDVLHDRNGVIGREYQTTGTPESFVIDRNGVIVKKVWGPEEWDDPTESAVFRRLLGLSDTEGEG